MTVLSTKPDEHSTIPGSDNENVRYYHIKAPFSHNEKPWVESRAQRNANSSYKQGMFFRDRAQQVKEPIVKSNDFSSIPETNSCKAKRCFTTTLQNNMISIQLETLFYFLN